MKQTISALLVLSLFLSCTKQQESTACYECITRITYDGMNETGTSTTSLCGKTPSDIREYETAGTFTSTGSSGGVTITSRTTTTCSKR